MIIAIPASADKTAALIDERFARCSFFCLFNTDSKTFEFKENSKRDAMGGAGPMVAEFLADKGVNEVWSVEIGPKAQDALNKLNINIKLVNAGQTVQDLIKSYV